MSKLLSHPQAIVNMARRVALAAGDITLEHFDEAGSIEFTSKEDDSPVTRADAESEEYITKALADIVPGIPVIAEEATAAGSIPDISGADHVWLVDPLDGTKAFIEGSPDYTVNIALIKNGKPWLGIVYAPALGEMYTGIAGEGAWRWLEDTNNEKDIRVRRIPASGLSVVTSATNPNVAKLESYLQQFKVEKVTRRRSALKMCMIAAGKADLYPRLGDTYEWDTAAGEAILMGAGGAVMDFDGNEMSYGRVAQGFINPSFVAGSLDLIQALKDNKE